MQIKPFKLRFKCKAQIHQMNDPGLDREFQVGNSDDLANSSVEDSIWYGMFNIELLLWNCEP